MQNLRKRVPTILTSDEILDKAFRKVNKIDKQGPDKVELVKRKSMARIASATDVISSTLMKYVKAFPSINERTDFLAEMIEVTVGVDKMKKALGNLDWAASKIKELQKQYTSKVMTSTSTFAADNARKAYYGRASSVVNKVGPDLEFLAYARNEFRKVPDFNDDMLTFVIAGFPNVGKSQFLRTISAAEPEVAAYPFTTKGIEVGIHEANHRRYQVIDTPGLLDRELEYRNRIEMQAVTALKHLANSILFILDPSESCGYLMEGQLRLLESVKALFPDVPILVVENKVDMIDSGSDRLKMSAATGVGVQEVMAALRESVKHLETVEPAF
ncbi:MAG TPA: 50S ribosome-binding GTPase [Methanomassiliicoccales archaeon]|nr:50S ribosome-binding GTPase [Methanomassiliicoccales archaeon]HPR98246.1 50S ribosome-binding GTPase [Methanomassiliicoccales archaeon]